MYARHNRPVSCPRRIVAPLDGKGRSGGRTADYFYVSIDDKNASGTIGVKDDGSRAYCINRS